VPARTSRPRSVALRNRPPTRPRPPAALDLATIEDHDLVDEATYRRLGFFDLDLTGRSAESVEFEQCRFNNTDLSGTHLTSVGFTDCLVERANLANLRVERSSMRRVRLSVLRMTGVHWVNGTLCDVTMSGCRADLSSFRFTDFHHVAFDDCNLTGADFQNADLSGVRFTDCDLSGVQFSQAKMAGTRFTGCVLSGIGGVTSMDGAIVASGDLVALSHTLASALGIRIEDGADPDRSG
jgi:uncharacterized protein YjbI with pentapeptide repeats